MKKIIQKVLIITVSLVYLLTGCGEKQVSTIATSSDSKELKQNYENDISFLNNFSDTKVDGVDTALLAINDVSSQIGIQDVSTELSFKKEVKAFENTYYTFEQEYEDLPVYGRKEVLSVDNDGRVLSLAGNYTRIDGLGTTPQIKEKEAHSIITEHYGNNVDIESCRLTIYSLFETDPQLSWDFYVHIEGAYEECIVSAINGEILLINPLITFNEMKGIGEDIDNNDVEFNVDLENGRYVMRDNERCIYMYDAGNDTLRYEFCYEDSSGRLYRVKNNNFEDDKGNIVTIEDNGEVKNEKGSTVGEGAELVISASTSNVFTKLEPVTNSTSSWTNKEAVTIYSRLCKIYDMWLSEFQCKGFNNNNGTVHAVCNDNQKAYGVFDDSGNAYSTSVHGQDLLLLSFGSKNSLSIDTIGHEYMHGVVRDRSNLIYQGEAGAINEGLADVFGEISEDWIKNGKLDGDCDWIHSNSRSLISPSQSPGNHEYPDTYKGFHWVNTSDTSDSNDHGGVHYNSTVISHAAYLMSTGINGHACFEPLNTHQIGKLFYSVLHYIPADCSFNELRAFTENVAEIMYTHGELTEKQRDCVSNAFFQVNIFKTSKPVSRQIKLTVIPLIGDEEYNDYTLYAIDQNNTQHTYSGLDIQKDGLTFPDFGDYEIRIIDNKNNNNVTSINVKVCERGGVDKLNVYTNCGVSGIDIDSEKNPSNDLALINIINTLHSEYGSLRIVQNNGEWQNEANGLCYLNLIDFTGDGNDELFAVCKNDDEDHYTGYIYTLNNGKAELIYENPQIEYNTAYEYDIVYMGYTKDTGFIFGTGWDAPDIDDRTFYWYKDGDFEPVYRSKGYYDDGLEEKVIEEELKIVDIFDDEHIDELWDSFPRVTLRTMGDEDENGDLFTSYNLQKTIDDTIRKIGADLKDLPSSITFSEEKLSEMARVAIYNCVEKDLNEWTPDFKDVETFWDLMSFYCSFTNWISSVDYPRAGEYEEYKVIPNNLLKNASFAFYKDFNGYLPEINDDIWRAQYYDDQSTAITIGDNAPIIIINEKYQKNDDGTIDAEYVTEYSGNIPAGTYIVHFEPNSHYNEVNADATYYYRVSSVERIGKASVLEDSNSNNSSTEQYQEVINEYRSAYNDFELYQEDSSAFMEKYPLVNVNALIEPYLSSMDPTFFSAIKDINEDGVDELIIGVDVEHPNSIYTFYGGQIIPLINDIGERSYINIYDDGTIYRHDSGGASFSIDTIYEINESGDGLSTIKQFETDWDRDPDYPYYDGAESLSQEQFNAEYLDKNEMEFNWSE